MQAQEVTLLATTSVIGDGTDENPFRRQYELWTSDGRLVCASDANEPDGSDGIVEREVMKAVCPSGWTPGALSESEMNLAARASLCEGDGR